jgi:hypothetical protein
METEKPRRKQYLPHPYNQDLSKILRGLNRRTPFGRKRAANDPLTAAYLHAAGAVDPARTRRGRQARHRRSRLADPDAGVVDTERQQCLLGKAALAIIAGCTEPADRPEGPALEEAITALLVR